MDDLIFIAEKHQYITADGLRLSSVSDVIASMSLLLYRNVDPELMAIAAMKGTAVHGAAVVLDEQKIAEVPAEYGGYLQGYVDFIHKHGVRWYRKYTEQPMRLGNEYAGTIDRFGTVDDRKTLVDIKTSSRITKKNLAVYEAQLNLYRRMLEAHEEKVEQMFILHLKKDGKYKLYEIPISDELADACLLIHNRMK